MIQPDTPDQLRDYQQEVVARFHAAVAAGHRRILIVAPTGAGKTVIAAAILRDMLAKSATALFLAHRTELIQQTSRKLHRFGIDHGIIKAGYPMRLSEPVQLASILTLWARAFRGTAIERPDAQIVMIDEAHRARARTYQKIIEAYPDAVIVGLTATPCRGDGRGLGNVFDLIIEAPQVPDLIEMGHLVPTRVYAPTLPDLSRVRSERGDYIERELAEVMDKPKLVGDIVEHWHKLADRRPTVVFATGVGHSVAIRDEFRRAGVMAEHIDGNTPAEERDAILAGLADGRVELVTNCMVLTEGWDSPSVSCLILARPTKQQGMYRQMVGRVLRPAPGKTDALVIDHSGATFAHGFAEDRIAWTLDVDSKPENPAHVSRAQGGGESRLTTCPECTAVRNAGDPCGVCGWKPKPKPVAVEMKDGELGLIDRRNTVNGKVWSGYEQRQFYAELVYIAQERGWSPKAPAAQYREKFGDWPDRAWRADPPAPPSDATRSWVKSRMIAFAKRRAAA